jgi:hypothetical protein
MAGNGHHRAWTLLASAALLLALVATAPVTALSPTACRVRNLDTATTRASLQQAVGAARAGDRLTVRGICRGTTRIGKDLTIRGVRTATSGKPILDGAMRGTVVVVRDGVRVTLRQLTLRRGVAQAGGAILNQGTLILRDVIVRASTAAYGGGVYNSPGAILRLNGSSSIRGNATVGPAGASYGGALPEHGAGAVDDLPGACGDAWQGTPDVAGGGVLNGGTLILNGSSSISGNRTGMSAGGVYNAGILTLNDSGSISRNTAGTTGGGVYNEGTLTMAGSSSISSNTATGYDGGGVCNLGDLSGVVCGDNVHDNTPDDCAP